MDDFFKVLVLIERGSHEFLMKKTALNYTQNLRVELLVEQ